ncbi:hypothetical protein PAECIP111891_00665 [Paenibacillus allorhizoplanae]|uniref:Right-handed parallel beta-helix repeat-containing protein n=1 Tax=Paenibacillus allorhizoplanae TaxID=2905648 RepID=A0ABM9BVE2_9BACL|nr:right-handed parallel beta-helix repeat-containing protein [Paenibacillus allorhizoplanae]CAH1195379.1 hypothetical protein PAECIP111891_00665 [Paenibacillus allorhizoplanae]
MRFQFLVRLLTVSITLLASLFIYNISAVQAAVQATYYASPTGSGTTCSLASPCSLSGVRDKVRTVNASMSGDIQVFLRGGTYTLSAPLTLDYRDSGTNSYRVSWSNYSNEVPVLSGGQSLTGGWTLHDAAANIYKKTGVTAEFRQLYVNDVPATRARIPNLSNSDTFASYYDTISGDVTNKQYKINKAEISNWTDFNQVEMVVQPHWYHNRLRLSSYTTDTNYAYVSFLSPDQDHAFDKSAPNYASNAYYFENAYEFLDAPGEWYLHSGTDTLFYKPLSGQNMSTIPVTIAVSDVLMNLAGTAATPIHHLTLSGLNFTYTGWKSPSSNGVVMTQGANPLNGPVVPGVLQATYAYELRISNNTFRHLGGTALKLGNGLKDSQIVGNTIEDVAANGIELKSPKNASTDDLSEHVLIGNNTITRVGQHYTNGIGIVGYFVNGVVIEHNDISYTPYMGIQLGGQGGCNCSTGMADNRIQYNDVHHVMQVHDDGGAIYLLGRQPGTYVVENYVHDIAKSSYAMSSPVAGLYLDNYSEFITVQHNVLSSIQTATGATLLYEQTGIGAMNNQWVNNNTQDTSVINQSGTSGSYVEAVLVRLDANFNEGASGSAPTGWSITNGDGSVTTADIPSTTDKSVLINKAVSTTTTTANKSLAASLSGIVSVRANIRVEQTSAWKMAPYVVDSSGVQAVSVGFDGGYIKTYNGSTLTTVQAFTAGTWCEIRIIMDTNTDQFDLYVDGIRLVTDASFRNPVTNIKTISFGIGTGHIGSFYLDDVQVLAP